MVHLGGMLLYIGHREERNANHLIHQYKELQLDDTNKYLLVFPLKAKHLLQHQLT
jgi:hypothetical protein